MARVDVYDAELAAELEKLWRDTMLKGATRGIENAIAQQLEPIRSLIEATKSAQAGQFRELETRIKQLEGIDQRLSNLLLQIDSGTQHFTRASTEMAAIPEVVGQLEGCMAKFSQLEAHLDALERRANNPDSLQALSDIVDAEGVPDEDRIQQLRLLIGHLQSAPLAPPPPNQNTTKMRSLKSTWANLTRRWKSKSVLLAVILMGLAALLLVTQSASRVMGLFDRQSTPAIVQPTELGISDERLIRAGWDLLKTKAPAMANQVGSSCSAKPCDIVELLVSSRAKDTNRKLAEAILQLRQPIAGEALPRCEYDSFDAMLKEARSNYARPQAVRACVRKAQLGDGLADRWTAAHWDIQMRSYLIAIGSIGDLGETIPVVASPIE